MEKKEWKLFVVSNHNPAEWGEEQKAGWKEIKYLPFPNISPKMSREEIREMASNIRNTIYNEITEKGKKKVNEAEKEYKFCIQGEFALCAELYKFFLPYQLVFPATERIVVERKKEDNSVEKTQIFKFVCWR